MGYTRWFLLSSSALWLVSCAFVKKDFLEDSSYRLAFAMDFIGAFLEIALFYFIAILIGKSADHYFTLESYSYFSFLLVGIAFTRFADNGMRSFSHKIQDYQVTGTLEAMLSSSTSIYKILFSSVLWKHLYMIFIVIMYFVMGLMIFGLTLNNANWLSVFCVLLLAIVSLSSLGIMAASFIMFYKRGDPVLWLFGIVSSILGGVYFPVKVLPDWLQSISNCLPITYILKAMRKALFQGATLAEIALQIIVLLLFCLILMPLSLMSFNRSVRKARSAGTLTHF